MYCKSIGNITEKIVPRENIKGERIGTKFIAKLRRNYLPREKQQSFDRL